MDQITAAIDTVTFAQLASLVTAIGALGAAAAGLVDTTKLFWAASAMLDFPISRKRFSHSTLP